MLAYLMSFYAIFKRQVSMMGGLYLMNPVFIFVADYATLKFSWTFLNTISEIVDKAKNTSVKLIRKQIRATTSPIVVRFGVFGLLDRDMFIFIGDIAISNTISMLLL